MNIESARSIPMTEILDKIGLQPAKKKQGDYWYYSPFRSEKTPSFKINIIKNTWYDFGENIDNGGDSIAFVCAYLKRTGSSHTVADALRWLRNMFHSNIPASLIAPREESTQEESNVALKSVKPLTHIALIRYLESRGISKATAQKFLKEIRVYNKETKKTYFAAGMKNEEGGYEYRNPYFKGCIKPKSITFIRGLHTKPEGIQIFEGMMDYLSIIERQGGRKFDDDIIVLNSLSCIRESIGYIHNYGYQNASTWFDNDEAGEQATQVFSEYLMSEKIQYFTMNSYYAPYKDVNKFHEATSPLAKMYRARFEPA